MPVRRAIGCVLLVAGCGGDLHDPADVLAERSAQGDTDCGTVRPPIGGAASAEVDAARRCVLDALAAARPFRVLIDQGLPDGTGYLGWVDDGAVISELRYVLGGDEGSGGEESIQWGTCVRLVDLGEDCGTESRQLCFRCQESW
jgi:hypothetical protein